MNTERLNKLADFLDRLEPRRFDFEVLVAKDDGKCGTVCCAMGWTPVVFPGLTEWYRDLMGDLSVRTPGSLEPRFDQVGSELFDITREEAYKLFLPYCELPWWPRRVIGERARPKTVAKSIRKFIEWKGV